ncbi:hypothetical protein ACHAW5_001325 [Stephanodiscus triporus]|uniref:Uncharacterized protein n=1 Tax=Stephanodiscus triporus TaxID=2934178 RepID=A0ABD3Q2C5_9STRA
MGTTQSRIYPTVLPLLPLLAISQMKSIYGCLAFLAVGASGLGHRANHPGRLRAAADRGASASEIVPRHPPRHGLYHSESANRGVAAEKHASRAHDDDDDDGGCDRGRRRSFLSRLSSAFVATAAAGATAQATTTRGAGALPFFGDAGGGRRQLELCLATVLRTEYWATNVARSMKTRLLLPPAVPSPAADDEDPAASGRAITNVESENQRRQPYLEARLGAKALLTQKIGGGANSRVRALGGFQLRGCLDDAGYWCAESARRSSSSSNKDARRTCSIELSSASEDLVESLASVVEFDGLETTIDPSPRSSLMLGMYTDQKATFVYRTLVERVVPSCERILDVFGNERRRAVEEYVGRDYGDEVPFEVLERLYGQQRQ